MLSEVSETARRKRISGLMLKISRLLAPPIHPRVSTVAGPSALRLISLAGRDGVLRSAYSRKAGTSRSSPTLEALLTLEWGKPWKTEHSTSSTGGVQLEKPCARRY